MNTKGLFNKGQLSIFGETKISPSSVNSPKVRVVTNYCVVTSSYKNTRWDVTIDTSFSISKFVAEQKSQTAIAHHHRNTSRDVEKPH